jgi:transposase
VHITKGYAYASTQVPYIDPKSKNKKYRYIHWGTVDEGLRFIPGSSFLLASPDERALLLFPEEWDLSAISNFTGLRHPGRPAYVGECQNSLYGDIWLLEKVAKDTGIRQDLETVFHSNSEVVDDLLTLAMFPLVTGFSYNRVARWQRNVKAPSSRELTPSVITRLTQSITEQNRIDLLKLRAAKLGKGEVCAVDTTSRSSYGDSLADIKWGRNKERLPLKQTLEVIVYSLTNHMPVYYRTFPGNIPDCRSLDVILVDLDHAGFKNPVLVTDRGFENLRNLEKYISRGQPMIMCTKTSQKDVSAAIDGLGPFSGRPEEMRLDSEAELYHKQYDIDYQVKGTGKSTRKSDRLRLSLYFDPLRRGREMMALDTALSTQEAFLRQQLENGAVLEDPAAVKKVNNYHKVVIDQATGRLKSFERDEKKVEKALKRSGFFAIMSHKLDYDAMTTYRTYRLRDEQEKCFQQMKGPMVSDRQRNWSEEGKTGRLLILFVSLILGSHVRYVWKSTNLCNLFSSSLEMLDEMRSIRCIEHTNKAKVITPFVGGQVAICESFGYPIPKGCAPAYTSRQTQNRKRGRPPKKKTEIDFK